MPTSHAALKTNIARESQPVRSKQHKLYLSDFAQGCKIVESLTFFTSTDQEQAKLNGELSWNKMEVLSLERWETRIYR